MLARIVNKGLRLIYLFTHPFLWRKHVQINGIPKIGGPSRLKLGKYVSFNDHCYIQCVGGVEIKDYVTISYGVTILTSGLDCQDYPNKCICQNRPHVNKPVEIGTGVWLCANSNIMPGVKIAPKIVVAAGSVVTKDLNREGWLYAGVPAVPVKKL